MKLPNVPDVDDVPAMTKAGRYSVLAKAHRETREALRDAITHLQSADVGDDSEAVRITQLAEQIVNIAGMWRHVE